MLKGRYKKEEPVQTQVHRNHLVDDVIIDLDDGRKTQNKHIDFKVMVKLVCFISLI